MAQTPRTYRRLWALGRGAAIILLVLFVLAPLLYMVEISITPESEIEGGTTLVPAHVDLSTYVQLWQTVDLGPYIRNSLIISVLTAAVATIVALGAAYVLARFRFRGNTTFRLSLIALQTVPSVMLLLPLFVLYVALQNTLHVTLIGQYPIIILTYLTFALPLATWLMLAYVGGIPQDLEESALVDGAARLGRRVVRQRPHKPRDAHGGRGPASLHRQRGVGGTDLLEPVDRRQPDQQYADRGLVPHFPAVHHGRVDGGCPQRLILAKRGRCAAARPAKPWPRH